ncbi:hypothetical protein llap_13986 [Limosa lapponica baueri]|uniref:Uncharacterized protein n=1 Tax=Limosa lapponica baueri TaxID=1758121 RepID=A0A2I0TPG1_LIMLA|nr:hypothetical protein llap_13986 [Limosa lapponica baueri]
MHNGMVVESAYLGEPQPFNTSWQPGTYTAAVLNLIAPTGFVLGNRICEQSYHNAALHPIWNYMALSPPHPLLAAEITCVKLNPRQGSPIPRSSWLVRNNMGHWRPMEGNMTCVDVFQIVPRTVEISTKNIKLNWTCRIPDACQHIWAMCCLAVPSSPPCEVEEVKGEKMLHGQEGTFACPPLQPFTVYSVTISLPPPSTILFTQLRRTKEMGMCPPTRNIKVPFAWQLSPSIHSLQ